ncbi:MAG: GumC family protein [Alphaproteobacteria bacterium]
MSDRAISPQFPTHGPAMRAPTARTGLSGRPSGGLSDSVPALTELMRVVHARQRIIIGTTISLVILAIVILFQMTPRYTASALVMVDPRTNQVVDSEAVLAGLGTDQATIENQLEIIRSRSLVERVVQDLNLLQDSEFNPPAGKPSVFAALNPLSWFSSDTAAAETPQREPGIEADEVINRFLSNLSVRIRGKSTALQINFVSEDPAKAARVANTLAEKYVNDQLEAKFEATRQATNWLSGRLEELGQQLVQAERAVEQYKIANNLTETSDGSFLINDQLADINAQLTLAQAELAESQAKLNQANSLYASGQKIDSISQVVNSPLIRQLRNQEAELVRRGAELRNRYGARHPRMIDIEAEQQNLSGKIDEEVRRIIQQMRNDVAVTEARVQALQSNMNAIEMNAAGQRQAQIRLRELERAANSSRQLYEAYLARFKETQDQEGIQTPDARILSRAPVPSSPSFPRTNLVLAFAGPVAFLTGLLFAFTAERLDNGFRTSEQIEAATKLPNLAVITEVGNKIKRSGVNPVDFALDRPLSAYAESVRGFLTAIKMSDVDMPPKVIGITSSVPSEGKTTFAATTARLAVKRGQRTILVDTDLRHPSVTKLLGFGDVDTGIVEHLSDDCELEAVIRRDDLTELDILPVAGKAINPPDLLNSQRMAHMIERLRNMYDLVILDTAPILPVNDTKQIVRLVDKFVFVVRWEQTPREAVLNGIHELQVLQASMAGTVLTRTHVRRHAIYNYGYYKYKDYNKYYTT